MDKNQQDLAWNRLPREFRKEVRRMWSVECDCAIKYKSELHKHRTGLMYELFGCNLTSDAEGEDDMLYVSRKRVQGIYAQCEKVQMDDNPNLPAEAVDAASNNHFCYDFHRKQPN